MAFIKCQYTDDYLLTLDLQYHNFHTLSVPSNTLLGSPDEELEQLAPWNEDVKTEIKRRTESSAE